MKYDFEFDLDLMTGILNLCDVRIGPTEDIVQIKLGKGTYSLYTSKDEYVKGIQLYKKGASFDRKVDYDKSLSIDGSAFGAYDAALFTECFKSDAEDFYYWGEEAIDVDKIVQQVEYAEGEPTFAVISTGMDGVFKIQELYKGKDIVGIEIEFSNSIDSDLSLQSDHSFRFDLKFRDFTAEVWIGMGFDRESVVESIVDELYDLSVDDLSERINMIVENTDSIDESLNLESFGDCFKHFEGLVANIVDGNDEIVESSSESVQFSGDSNEPIVTLSSIADCIDVVRARFKNIH